MTQLAKSMDLNRKQLDILYALAWRLSKPSARHLRDFYFTPEEQLRFDLPGVLSYIVGRSEQDPRVILID